MAVVATAGHVDHGKSTLIRALTGMEPDRLDEERRRGLTIDLGFAWVSDATWLPSEEPLAFVDVPGHERFVKNMLAGAGPIPAVLFVVAADDGWMPQSEEHLRILEALDVRHGVLALTRADLASPDDLSAARAQAVARLAAGSLGGSPVVQVSAPTGRGLAELRRELARMVARLPEPDRDADVRFWVDRAFTVSGAGTVVTGTLAAGTLEVGDELQVSSTGAVVRVRGLQSLGRASASVAPISRVAVNVRGAGASALARGIALLSPGRWLPTATVDIRATVDATSLPRRMTMHVGSAGVPVSVRPLGSAAARLTGVALLPLRIGDRVLLRDPGRHDVVGGTILDVAPRPLRRRGAAAERGRLLAGMAEVPTVVDTLRSRGFARIDVLQAIGHRFDPASARHGWLVDATLWQSLRSRLSVLVDEHVGGGSLGVGMAVDEVARRLDLPDRALVMSLVDETEGVVLVNGQVTTVARADPDARVPAGVRAAVRRLRRELEDDPFHAPEAGDLARLGLGRGELSVAIEAGLLMRVGPGIVLLPGADKAAADRLARLDQPFTASAARQALHTTRRVVIPLLEHLDRSGSTIRLDEQRRTVVSASVRHQDVDPRD